MHDFAIERDRVERAMRGLQNRHARRFVNAARLHADETILDDVDTPDAVLTAELVPRLEQRHRIELLSIDRDRLAFVERDLEVLRFGARVLRRARELKNIF